MRIAVLIGTRPGIIKMAPLVHEIDSRDEESIVVHSGQHYSDNMDNQILQDVELREPDYHITRPENCVTHAQQTAYMLTNIEEVLRTSEPDVLLVCGDANTNLAGALAARKLHIKVGHVEAGLRSFDWRMPEEHNRVMIDHISEYLFAPTDISKTHLKEDGVRGDVFVVGNTIVDSTIKYATRASIDEINSHLNQDLKEEYAVLTLHREENVDDPDILERVLVTVERLANRHSIPIVFPVHPRTNKRLDQYDLWQLVDAFDYIMPVDAFRYRLFLKLLDNATFVMTDSGGIQEESCILQVPCITIRESTERPETVEVGANQIAGTNCESINSCVDNVINGTASNHKWENPYGDGKTSERIVDTCISGSPSDEFASPVQTVNNQ